MTEKTRYSDEELEEFRQIINEKLALAKRDYDQMMSVLMNKERLLPTRHWKRVVSLSRKRN